MAPSRSVWLVNAPVDLVFGAGLLAPLVMLLAMAVAQASAELTNVLLVALAALVLVPHIGASLLRAWRSPSGRAPAVALAAAAMVGAPLVVAAGDRALEIVWTVAAVLLPCHVALQVHRATAIVARVREPGPLAVAAALALALCGVVAVLSGPRAPLILRGFLSSETGVVFVISLAVVALGLALGSARQRGPSKAIAFTATAFTVAGAGWVVPLVLGGAVDPEDTSANAFALAHASQLLWLALFLEPRIAAGRARTFDPIAFIAAALVVGALFTVDLPWLASRAAGIDVVTALLALQGTFAIAHAAIDALVFRLTDPEIANAAFGDAAPAPHGRASVSNARAALFFVPGALLATGLVVHVMQAWLVRPGAPERDLLRAETLHPHDARVLLPQAAAALSSGEVDAARSLLGEIAIARAFSPAAARARFVVCLVGADPQGAHRCGDVPAYLADDIDVLAYGARSALAAGQLDVAKQKATRAFALAPGEPTALAAIGIVEAALQELPARDHLLRAIEVQRERTGADPLVADPGFHEVGLALAEAHRTRREFAPADAVLERVLEGATKADRPQTALRALALRGRIRVATDDPRGALDAYQRALRIAPFAKLPADEAELWLDYGTLLQRSASGPAESYASALQAFNAAERLGADHPQKKRLQTATTKLRDELEGATPLEDQERVRSDLEAAAERALTLEYPAAP